MQDFALLRHITIGQYLPGDSLVHRMDPRAKITVVLLLSLALTVNTSYLANILLLALCLGLIRAAGISLRYVLNGVRPALPFIIALSLMQLAFYGNPSVTSRLPAVTFLRWGPIFITSSGLQLVLVSLARFVDLMILASILTNTTPLAYLAYGLEDMLRPFGRLGVPAHEISLIFILALRFVPILAEQLETLAKAQASRGADIGAGGRWRFWHTARAMLVLIVPLFLDAFRRAEELIVAMEARCYAGGRGRTRLVQLQMRPADVTIIFITAVLSAGFIWFRKSFPF